jgi:hypothetical protein
LNEELEGGGVVIHQHHESVFICQDFSNTISKPDVFSTFIELGGGALCAGSCACVASS